MNNACPLLVACLFIVLILPTRAQYRADAKTTVSAADDRGQTRLFLDESRTPAPIGTVLWFVADRAGNGVPLAPSEGAILGADDVLLHVDRVDGTLAGSQLGRFNRSGIQVVDSSLATATVFVYLWSSAQPGEFVPRAGERFDVLSLGVRPPPQVGNALWFISEDMFADRHVVGGAGSDTPPSITGQPEDLSVVAGGSAVFRVTATGNPAPTYQWRRQGTNLVGATLPVLTLTNVQMDDAGDYSVLVSNRAGDRLSRAARLLVTLPPSAPVIVEQPQTQTVIAGERVIFRVVTTGEPPFTYQWSKDDENLPGQISDTLVIDAAYPENAGTYRVRVSNAGGTTTSDPAVLAVNAAAPVRLSVTLAAERLLFAWSGGTPPFRLLSRGEAASGPWTLLLETSGRAAELALTNPAPAALFFVIED